MADKKEKTEKYRKMLLAARAAILRELEFERGYVEHNEQGDIVDVADTQIANSVINTLSALDQKKLKDIDLALEKIEKGTYGTCEGTGKKIPAVRLQHIPWARYTIEYAEKLEREQRMSNGS